MNPAEAAQALGGKAFALAEAGRDEEALAVFDDLIERFRGAAASDTRECVSQAILSKGITLSHLARYEEAVRTFDSLFDHGRAVGEIPSGVGALRSSGDAQGHGPT